MWAARPIKELAVLGSACTTLYRTRLQSLFWSTGTNKFSIISAYTGPGDKDLLPVDYLISCN